MKIPINGALYPLYEVRNGGKLHRGKMIKTGEQDGKGILLFILIPSIIIFAFYSYMYFFSIFFMSAISNSLDIYLLLI